MSENQPCSIRLMTINDLDQAMSLSMTEGWNQTENDWRLLLDNPQNTCIIAKNNNIITGTATALNFNNRVAWIGMVLVDKALRGQGIGKMLLTDIIKRLKATESVKLDATPAGQPLYKSLGFKEEHDILRMTTSSSKTSPVNAPVIEIKHIDKGNLPKVIELDKAISGYNRTYLLNSLLQYYPERAWTIMKNNISEGYIFGRYGNLFNYIGPVYAQSVNSAKALISEAISSLDDKPFAIDVLQDKTDLIEWLESIGFVIQRQFTRMYLRSNQYSGIVNNQYLISGPEYG
jgi:ribosomal protein S18 acetylase RimI-like enzyme